MENEIIGPTVTVEAARRGGWGRGLTEQITFQLPEKTAQVLRIMVANDSGWSQADFLRDAIEGEGLASLEGYARALAEYESGRRIAKAPASSRSAGGRKRTR